MPYMTDDQGEDRLTPPAQDPPSGWEGPDAGDIPESVPEADSPEVKREWEESDPMGGPSPTG